MNTRTAVCAWCVDHERSLSDAGIRHPRACRGMRNGLAGDVMKTLAWITGTGPRHNNLGLRLLLGCPARHGPTQAGNGSMEPSSPFQALADQRDQVARSSWHEGRSQAYQRDID